MTNDGALAKGANCSVPTCPLTVEVAWQAAPGLEMDASALLLGANGRVESDAALIFYNQPTSSDGSVRHTGRLPGGGDRLTVDAAYVPATVERIVFVASIYDAAAKGQTLAHVAGLRIVVLTDERSVQASFAISGLSAETGLVFGELYRRAGGWKFRAVGQGYAAGLHGIATEFGIALEDEPVAETAPAPVAPATPAAVPISLHKQRALDLREKVKATAPGLLDKFDAAAETMERQGLLAQRANVVLILDVSGSSRPLFRNGTYQQLVNRILAAGLLFDDNGTIETWLFDNRLHQAEPVTLANRDAWADRQLRRSDLWGQTHYAPPIARVADRLHRGATTPTYVAFVTDGGNQDRSNAQRILRKVSGLPMFVQFIAVGEEDDFPFLQRLDDLRGREVDNVGFVAVQDPTAMTDGDFYNDVMMDELPRWLPAARQRGILS